MPVLWCLILIATTSQLYLLNIRSSTTSTFSTVEINAIESSHVALNTETHVLAKSPSFPGDASFLQDVVSIYDRLSTQPIATPLATNASQHVHPWLATCVSLTFLFFIIFMIIVYGG